MARKPTTNTTKEPALNAGSDSGENTKEPVTNAGSETQPTTITTVDTKSDDENSDVGNHQQSTPTEPAQEMIKLRLRTHRFPYRRAGFSFPTAREWHEIELPATDETAEKINAWYEDPDVNVEMKSNNAEWLPVQSISPSITEFLEGVAPSEPK